MQEQQQRLPIVAYSYHTSTTSTSTHLLECLQLCSPVCLLHSCQHLGCLSFDRGGQRRGDPPEAPNWLAWAGGGSILLIVWALGGSSVLTTPAGRAEVR